MFLSSYLDTTPNKDPFTGVKWLESSDYALPDVYDWSGPQSVVEHQRNGVEDMLHPHYNTAMLLVGE